MGPRPSTRWGPELPGRSAARELFPHFEASGSLKGETSRTKSQICVVGCRLWFGDCDWNKERKERERETDSFSLSLSLSLFLFAYMYTHIHIYIYILKPDIRIHID